MKKFIFTILTMGLGLVSSKAAYVPISISSGFNADVVANGVGTALATTTASVDVTANSFLAKGWQLNATSTPSTVGLPANGFFMSAVATTPGLMYQLADYSANNSARIPTNGGSQVLTLTTPISMKKLFVLATSGDNSSVLSGTITFSDGTTQTINNTTIADWFNGVNPPYAIYEFGRVTRNAASTVENPSENPRLYQVDIDILPANLNKLVSSVTVVKHTSSNANGILNVMALSAEIATTNDIGVTSLVSPQNFCLGSHSISVKVKNFGNNVINNGVVNWTLDNLAQPAVNLTQGLDTIGGTGINEVTVTLGSHNFTGPVVLKAWTSNPNGIADGFNANDTLTINLHPALGGTYTINSANPTAGMNFQTITDFVYALNTYGVCSAVVANVAPTSGPYNDLLYFGDIAGSSALNTIRINGNGRTVQYNHDADNRQFIRLIGTKYVTIDSLNFVSQNSTYGWAAVINGGAAYDSITRCTFNLSATTTTSSSNASGICFSGSLVNAITAGTNAKHCYIANNTIQGPTSNNGYYYALSLTSGADSNTIINNKFFDYYFYGIYANGSKHNLIKGNEMARPSKTAVTTFYGFYATGAVDGTRFESNRIHSPGGTLTSATNTSYGIYYLGSGNVSAPVIFANNSIYKMNSGGLSYGIYLSGATHTKVLHNTIVYDQIQTGTSNQAGIWTLGTNTGLEIINNNIAITGGNLGTKYGINYTTAVSLTSIADAQKNNVYVQSTQTGNQWAFANPTATTYATLAAFQTANPTLELGSPSTDPQFTSPLTGDFTPQSPLLLNAGSNLLTIVPNDINGITRSATPTIGAFEAAPVGLNDAAMQAILNPNGNVCATTVPVEVIFRNAGTNNISSLQINWSFNGVNQTPFTYTNTLVPFTSTTGQNSDTVILGNILLTNGANNIKVWTNLPNGQVDPNNLNDTLITVFNTSNFTLSPTLDTICPSAFSNIELTPGTGYAPDAIAWESSNNAGASWSPIIGANSTVYQANNLSSETHFRAKITNGSAVCYSDTAIIRIINVNIDSVNNAERCGPGSVALSAYSAGGGTVSWYDAPTSGTALFTGNDFTTPNIITTTTYYVSASVGGGAAAPTTLSTINSGGNSCGGGVMFDLDPNVNITVDSFSARGNAAGTNVVINIYTKTGTFQGNETNAAAWTLYEAVTVPNTVNGALFTIPLSTAMSINALTGVYIQYNASYTNLPTPTLFSNTDLDIIVGTGLCSAFGGTNLGRAFNGSVHYRTAIGCESLRVPVTATVNPAPVFSLGNDTAICPNGSVSLNATAPTGISYIWNTGETTPSINTNLAGTYHVEVSDGSCSSFDTVIVSNAPNPLANLNDTNSICDGDIATLDAGNAGASYLWSDNSTTQTITTQTAGIHTVNITNSFNCSIDDSIFVEVHALPIVDLGNDTMVCAGAALVLDAENPGASYVWNTGDLTQTLNVNQGGTYSVTVTNSYNCEASDQIIISEFTQADVDGFTFVPRFELAQGLVEFFPINPTYVDSFHWNFGDGNTSSLENPTNTYASNGNYQVTLSVFNDCGSKDTTLYINVDLFLGVNIVNNNLAIDVYPVPAQEKINIESPTPGVQIKSVVVVNALGQEVMKVKQSTPNATTMSINVNHLATGNYFLKIETNQGNSLRKFNILK